MDNYLIVYTFQLSLGLGQAPPPSWYKIFFPGTPLGQWTAPPWSWPWSWWLIIIRFLNQYICRLLLRMTWALIIIWRVENYLKAYYRIKSWENSKSNFDFIQAKLQISKILPLMPCRWSHVQSSYLRFRKKCFTSLVPYSCQHRVNLMRLVFWV